ncbi:MAG: RNA polymerase subunit sigma-24 [Acidobacteria bacterium 13_1_40CM_65_14]|nr:MAG: RNA polymerase subunit sigma-24 [Acidobacteria bacterium 13_1_40CM_65_14]
MTATDPVHETVNAVYFSDSRRVLATLIRLLGDFDAAEEALHDAFRAALEQWPRDGVPANPRAWLVSTGRFKAIDGMRRRARFDALDDVGDKADIAVVDPAAWADEESVEDDRLRLIFTCCHPAMSPDAQVALTLREVCGLTTEEIAQAFLTPAPTLAQRIVRAKAKIRDARIPYEVPARAELAERLDAVLRVIYLVFNEGYAASSGSLLTRHDLSAEAIRLERLLVALLPEPEAIGLLALMLLQDSRRAARTSPSGDVILLDDQDRSLWDRNQIAEGIKLVEQALSLRPALSERKRVERRFGPYTIQAAIAALHAEAPSAAATDWAEIVGLYDVLARADPSPVIELNRAVAVAMRDGPAAGLALVDAILEREDLLDYRLAHAARADLCRRLGKTADARASYERALALTRQAPERRFLERRLAELT